jgi:hypothetical protein
MEINKYKIIKINKSTSINNTPFSSTDNFFNLRKYESKTINDSSFHSIKKIFYKKNKNTKNKLLIRNISLINLPSITHSDTLEQKLFYNVKLKNSNKIRNIKLVHLNNDGKNQKKSLLFFDSSIKSLYENIKLLKNNPKFQEERKKKKDELYYDYDEKNYYNKHNSFSGNNANIMKKKVIFVKNIFDYIYPKIVINRMKFLDKKRMEDIKYQVDHLTKKFRNKYYINKFKSPEETSAFAKYRLNGAFHDENIKTKGNLIKLKKVMINGHSATQLTKDYDYLNK